MARSPYSQVLTPEEAARAIYIDFEGRKGEAPALLGSLYFEGRQQPDPERLVMRHDILDPTLAVLAGAVRIDGLHRYDSWARTLPQAVHDLIRRAKAQRRPIVSWSHHEISILEEAELSSYLRRWVARWYRDGKATARRWRAELHPEWRLDRDQSGRAHRLGRYLDRIGYEVPEAYRSGSVGETIKQLRAALEHGGGWGELTASRQRRWMELLMHNFLDVDGLRVLMERATADLAAR